ncbi:penicillin-binding transpeptidase domain-containing protein [Corynebacterium anserum]|uniref:Penicillin-binding transpeptidase domain-containing protein n=1 Tax=Corynebacterium anserum TaxID=2684406 RepID=A0A7G7YNU3_9CORY|nr:penicillin-binding transpeptidase domain-containing protein [Corynebacterium anserum]QNH96163.1 penicillin-binding transpeptidase domain-containing protein [Corynebacterium anserum]
MRRSIVSTVLASSLVFTIVGCTPRPDVADDAAEAFLKALSNHTDAGEQTDNPSAATAAIEETWQSLQAEGLEATLKDTNTDGTVATANYTMNWDLPNDRHFEYDARMTLTKSNGHWTVRWVPTVMHPDLGANQHLELRSVKAEIANVVGSDGAVLLEPGKTYRVFVNTKKTDDLLGTMRRISGELDEMRRDDKSTPQINPEAKAREARDVDGEYSVLSVSAQQGQHLKEVFSNEPGIRLNEEQALVRPDPGFAPDIMSRVSRIVEGDLQGNNGWKVVAATKEGSEVRKLGGEDAKPAPSVHVSLSRKVQDAAQAAVNTRSDAKTMMVVMRPSTGEILAVAQTEKADEDGDAALMGQYPPGSTFKMITTFAGMQRQGLTPDSTVGCPGTQNIGGRIVTNYNSFSLGMTSLESAFARSCNTTFANISTQLKPGELKDTAAQFGIGQDFTIDGLDTVTGTVPDGEKMLDRTEAGYGQGLDLVSPFGMAVAASTAAAGKMPTPYLIAGTNHKTDVKGEQTNPLPKEQTDGLRRIMRAVVTSGSGTGVSGAGDVYAKTGEAEISGGSHSWLVGYRGDLAFATLIVLGGGSEHATKVTNTFFTNLDAKED